MAVTTATRRTAIASVGFFVLIGAAHTVNDSFTSMLSALLPTLQARFEVSETVLAMLVAMKSFSTSVTQPFFGAVADRLGRRLVGALGIVLSSGLLSLMAVAPTVAILFWILLIGGLGSAAFHPAGTSIARGLGGSNKSLAVGIFSATGTLGLAVGPVAILLVANNFGLAASPWLMVPGLILAALMYILIPPQERAPKDKRPKLFDRQLFAGPVGLLCLSGILRSIPFVTFVNAIPLWLVNTHGVARDGELIGWTLAAFSAAAGLGGIIAGLFAERLGRQVLISGTMILSLPVFLSVFWLEAGSPLFFLAIITAGALTNGGLPIMIVSAQDLAPHAMGTASGMLMGFTWGTAGIIYIGIGWLQELIGISSAMSISYLALIPGALLASYVLHKNRRALSNAA